MTQSGHERLRRPIVPTSSVKAGATHSALGSFKLSLVLIWRGFRLVYGRCRPRRRRFVWLTRHAREISKPYLTRLLGCDASHRLGITSVQKTNRLAGVSPASKSKHKRVESVR